jgi:hypothetical protein
MTLVRRIFSKLRDSAGRQIVLTQKPLDSLRRADDTERPKSESDASSVIVSAELAEERAVLPSVTRALPVRGK